MWWILAVEPRRRCKLGDGVLGLLKFVPGSRGKANFDRKFALTLLEYAKFRSIFKFRGLSSKCEE